ncbi:hypothetical protein SESBI_33640 [Sesbania bispinosa]|nr:hypothetical protein SESBI_33640 [Sesbania bispinosa]
MAENINSSNIGSQPSRGVNAFEDLASQSNERIEDTVVAGVRWKQQTSRAITLTASRNELEYKVMMMRQQYMEGSLKHVVNKVDENRSTELKVAARKSEQVLGGTQVTPNGATKMDWDSIHLEPFENQKDDLYFVVGSDEDDGYFHDMAIKKSKQKLPTHSSKTPRKYITGNSFVKTENDVFYNMEKGVDLKQLASNFIWVVTKSAMWETRHLWGSLDCLCPDKRVDRELVRLLARKITYIQQQQESQIVWCLPPTFVWDVLRGNHVPKLLDDYTEVWMPPSQTVKYAENMCRYVPFEAYGGHWSLFVVGLHEAMLYYLIHLKIPKHFLKGRGSFTQWVIQLVKWCIANHILLKFTQHTMSLNSGAAVLDWMSMAEAFTANVSPMKNANLGEDEDCT